MNKQHLLKVGLSLAFIGAFSTSYAQNSPKQAASDVRGSLVYEADWDNTGGNAEGHYFYIGQPYSSFQQGIKLQIEKDGLVGTRGGYFGDWGTLKLVADWDDNGSGTEDILFGFGMRGPGGLKEAMRIKRTGNRGQVGIGTISPQADLHVMNNSDFGNSSFLLGLNGTSMGKPTASLSLKTNGGLPASVETNYGLVLNDAGNKGIGIGFAKDISGRLEPGMKLSVNGATYIGDFTNAGYNSTLVKTAHLAKYKLWVEDGIVSEDYAIAKVEDWADYVFYENYKLPKLAEVEAFIKQNKHLPNLVSEAQVKANGYSVHSFNKSILKTSEELTLYVIEQDKEINSLKEKNKAQEAELQSINEKLSRLEKLLTDKK